MAPAAQRPENDPEPARVPTFLRAARIVHPFPSFLNAAATVGLTFAAADGSPEFWLVTRMAVAMLLAQFCIGVANDIFDRELDAATKPWKPVPAGLISPRTATGFAFALLAVALLIAGSLGWKSLLLFVLGTSCGLTYDAGLKRTLLSPVPFMVAIPVLPAWVYVTMDAWEPVLWWLLPLGVLLGLSIHLANTLPDIESDTEHGIRGFAHVLGVRRSLFLSWSAFALALVLAAVIATVVDADPRWYVPTLAIGALCLGATIASFVARGSRALQANFGLTSVGAVMCAAGWLAAVT